MASLDKMDVQPFSMPSDNPLARYFRVPGLHVKLPTGGAFMPVGSIDFTVGGDVPVFPMAAKDELLLKSPDALMSGYALEKLIESCVPAIRQPRAIATQDLDVLLLAIRAATYGDTMQLDATCPSCQTVNEINCHLPSLLATMETVDPDNTVRLSDEIVAHVRPYSLGNATMLALASFDESRKLQALENSEVKATGIERNRAITQSMDRINALNLDMLADCIIQIVVPGAVVTDRKSIKEFVANVPKPWVEAIDTKLREVNGKGIDKKMSVMCENSICKHEWATEIEFNPSTFFEAASSR